MLAHMFRLIGAMFVLPGLASGASVQSLNVVVTIKPVHSLVASLLQGVAEPKLLLKGGGSPHAYALRPSDAEILSQADVVIRVSPELENFLTHSLATLSKRAMIIDLDKLPGLPLLPARKGSNYEEHEHDLVGAHAHAVAGKEEHDVHFWLDPKIAMEIVAQLAKKFAEKAPSRANEIQANAARLKARLQVLDHELQRELSQVRSKPFIVFHDVAQYFERRYGLTSVGAITVSPERQPGAKRLAEIRAKIENNGAICVFAEPQFPPKLVQSLIAGTQAKEGVFDEIGVGIPEGPDHYFAFLRQNARNLKLCLNG